jgi:Transposase DDE domain
VILFILQKGLRSLQGRLLDFFERLALEAGEPAQPVTAGAWSQARAKLRHTAFIELNEEAVLASFYHPENDAQVRRWRGHRLCAIDGSLLQLPESEALGQHFGWEATANGRGPCAVRHVQARASVYYDLLNALALEARLEPGRTAERALGTLHLGAVRSGDVVMTDRGYCGLEWFGRVQGAGADFVCRVSRRWRREADALFAANQAGLSRRVELAVQGRLRRVLRQAGFVQAVLRVRLVTVRLATGELEVLATSLLDEAAYPTPAFGEVYHWRWGIETFYGALKGRLGLENFTGESLEAVRQDFFSSVFLSNVESVLSAPAQAELSTGDAQRRYAARVNRAQSFHALKSQALALFYREGPAEEILAELTRLMQLAPVAQRPERVVPRRTPSLCRSLHHLRYKKKHPF